MSEGVSRVVVIGGAGRTGRLVVEEAVRDGHQVTLAARRPEDLGGEGWTPPPGVRVVRADARDAASVAAALADQDAVVLCVSSSARRPGGLYSDAARSVVAGAAGPLRVLAISSGGVRQDDPALPGWYRRLLIPFVMKDLYDDMGVMEAVIRDSPLAWTFVRASYLRDRPARGRFRVEDGATPAGGWSLSRADLARFTVDQLRSDRWLRCSPTLAD